MLHSGLDKLQKDIIITQIKYKKDLIKEKTLRN